MKKIIRVLIAVIIIFNIFCCSGITFANEVISVVLDGKSVQFDAPPCIIEDRTFVPARALFGGIGVNVEWDESNKMLVASGDNVTAWYQVGNMSSTYVKNGEVHVYQLNATPRIIDDRLFVPVRAIGDIFDVDIGWDEYSRSVIINTGKGGFVYTENLRLDGFVPPQTVMVGGSFVLYGEVVSSTVPVDRVNVKITDKASSRVEVNETQFDIISMSYKLSDIDNRVKFGILSPGEKQMIITAVNMFEQRRVFEYDFEIKRPGGHELGTSMEMLWPVPSSGLITTIFWCDNVFCHSNGGRANGHSAIDIAANENADVVAVQDGVVRDCGFGNYENKHSGYGNYIEVDHGNGIVTQYAHLYSIYVEKGQVVAAGQVIGGVGNTGNSTGNHLDFAIESNGNRCDPLYYLNIPSDARCYEPCDKIYYDKALQSRGIKQ